MKRLFLAACLSAPGLALAQSGGVVIIGPGIGDVGTITIGDPITIGTVPPPSFIFAPIVISMPPMPKEPMSRALYGALTQDSTPAIPYALDPGAILYGEQPILTVEEEGVRLPDEQFSLP